MNNIIIAHLGNTRSFDLENTIEQAKRGNRRAQVTLGKWYESEEGLAYHLDALKKRAEVKAEKEVKMKKVVSRPPPSRVRRGRAGHQAGRPRGTAREGQGGRLRAPSLLSRHEVRGKKRKPTSKLVAEQG